MKNSVPISALVITYNEENNIERCLNSLDGIADEIVVIDSFSTDRTAEICKSRGVNFDQHRYEGQNEQKNYALSQANFDYILSLDADEALSEKLKQSILAAKQNWEYDGHTLNRLTNYCGRWIRHCGWYPDRKLRLFDRRKGRWGGVNPHDHVIMDKDCSIGHLGGDLLHYSYPTIKQHVRQIDVFSDIAAREAFQRGRKANILLDICLNPTLTFFKKYFLKLGILDGYEGFVISISTAYGKFLKYIKLRELERQDEHSVSHFGD
ncbi:MAG: glycosyltransferase family 2 protein [Desulfobacterales bacterium]|jgi:glycosyltransferase involved in cell wall biosynthesis